MFSYFNCHEKQVINFFEVLENCGNMFSNKAFEDEDFKISVNKKKRTIIKHYKHRPLEENDEIHLVSENCMATSSSMDFDFDSDSDTIIITNEPVTK